MTRFNSNPTLTEKASLDFAESNSAAPPTPNANLAGARTRLSLDSRLRRYLALSDAVMVVVALIVSLRFGGHSKPLPAVLLGLAGVPLMIVLFKLYGLYDRDVKRLSHSTVDDLPWLFHAVTIGVLLFWLYSKGTPVGRLDFEQVVLLGGTMMVGVLTLRWVVRAASARWSHPETAVLVGGGPMADALVSKLRAHAEYRTQLIGTLDCSGDGTHASGLPSVGCTADLKAVVSEHGVARVIVSAHDIDSDELEELLRQCRKLCLKVSVLPQLSDVLGPAVEIDDVEGVAVLGVNPPWLPRSSRMIKRGMDVAIASAMLLLLSPLLVLLAIAIKLESRGPVLFTQERVGRSGQRFRLFKFRSMVADAEAQRLALFESSNDPDWLLLERDPRITRLGAWLRRLSLDELPQLLNVLRGQMSIVGPRPLIPAEDERVTPWARGRLDLTPGMTGYWQVLGRTRIPFGEMVKLDYLYVMNWSLWEDIRLILRTLPVVIGGRGVN